MTVNSIAFTLNGRPQTLPPGTSPTMSLLDWLRGPAALTGTKEGCAEGDCGACTVVLEEASGARIPVNACLTLLGQVHGRAIRTVEGLRAPDGTPHPIQVAMAESDGTQCGFCTPGIVMSAWAHARISAGAHPRYDGEVHEALAGNLCRCTGYRPIVEVLSALPDDTTPPPALPRSPPRGSRRRARPSICRRRWTTCSRCAPRTRPLGCWRAAPTWGSACPTTARCRGR
jgi:xanthine dehydrogenase small subunit